MSVKSSGGVFEVLRALAASTTPLGASELASQLGLPASTAGRAAATLEASGFARRAQAGAAKFELGSAGQLLAYAFMSQFPIRDAALPYLQQLASVSGFSSSLFLRLGQYALRIAFIAGTNGIINVTALGEAHPLTEGAAGRAMLAQLPAPGWALAASALDQGGYDLAFPLTDVQGKPVAAVVLEGLPAGFGPEDERIAAWTEILRQLQLVLNESQSLVASPYDHIDTGQIDFGGPSGTATRSA